MALPPKSQTLVQNNDTYNRLSQLREALEIYRHERFKNNKTATPAPDLQNALFKAAKIGNIKLMMEFISHGANPFAMDENNCDAFSYAMEADPIKAGNVLLELISESMEFDEGDNEG